MTKTNTTYKVSAIKPQNAEEFKPKAQTATGPEDAYKSSSPDAYKGLIDGNFKAEALNGGVLEEMHQAVHQPYTQKTDYHSAMQDLIGGLMVGDTRATPPQDTMGNIPVVPKLERDILAGTTLHKNMEPVVERYAAMEKVLITMYDNLRVVLHPRNMCTMTSQEIRALQSYKKKLEQTLGECRLELEKAREYLQKQKKAEAEENSLPELELLWP